MTERNLDHVFPEDQSRWGSAYTLTDDAGDVTVYEDDLFFMTSEPRGHNTNVIGLGLVGREREQMQLIMSSEIGRIAGRWCECNFDSGAVRQYGEIEFVAGDDGRYYGYWTSQAEGQLKDAGTWVLTPY